MLCNRSLFLSPEGDPAPPTLTVQVEGKDVTVPVPAGVVLEKDLVKTHITAAAHNAQMASMRKQLDAAKDFKDPEALLGDETFKQTALERWQVKPGAGSEQLQKQLDDATKRIRETEVSPLKTKLDLAEGTIGELRTKELHAKIVAGAQGKVDEKFLKAPVRGQPPLVVQMLAGAFAFDPEHGQHFAKAADGKSFQYSTRGIDPYMPPDEFIDNWIAADGKEFAKSTKQDGAEANTTGTKTPGQQGSVIYLTEAQMRDPATMRSAQKRVDDSRGTLTIARIA